MRRSILTFVIGFFLLFTYTACDQLDSHEQVMSELIEEEQGTSTANFRKSNLHNGQVSDGNDNPDPGSPPPQVPGIHFVQYGDYFQFNHVEDSTATCLGNISKYWEIVTIDLLKTSSSGDSLHFEMEQNVPYTLSVTVSCNSAFVPGFVTWEEVIEYDIELNNNQILNCTNGSVIYTESDYGNGEPTGGVEGFMFPNGG